MPDTSRSIKVTEALRCIKAGFDDSAMMERFRLSPRGLQSLFEKLVATGMLTRADRNERARLFYDSVTMRSPGQASFPYPESKPKIRIHLNEALECVRSGMDDVTLMRKYNLSAQGLESLLRKLVAAGAVTQEEVDVRRALVSSHVDVEESQIMGSPDDAPRPAPVSPPEAEKMLCCIRSGMSRGEICAFYSVSDDELQRLLEDLMAMRLISQHEIDRRIPVVWSHFQVRHRSTEEVICEGKAASLRSLIESALAAGIDLSDCDLRGINLARCDLSKARLSRADLSRAILIGSDLTRAQLTGATLTSAEMTGAKMVKANLAEADLSDANLSGVEGHRTILCMANLSEANLSNARLTKANLAGANLFQTITDGTDMTDANLEGAKLHAD